MAVLAQRKGNVGLAHVRNIGIMAHIDAGKTTVAERILYSTGRTHRMGSVDAGNATLDWMDQERERGITIVSAATTTYWRGHRINLIDTPGHVDFTVEVERSLRVLDGAIALFCGVGGVEPQSEAVWRQAEKYGVPAVAFVNKMDRTGADFARVVDEIRERLAVRPVPVVAPLYWDGSLVGVLDLVEQKAVYQTDAEPGHVWREEPVPEAMRETFELWRHQLLEAVGELEEALLEKYCLNERVSPEELRAALRRATLAGKAVPVLCGSALRDVGVRGLLDAVVDYLPSPADLQPVIGACESGQTVVRRHSADEPLAALAFKVVADRHMGKMVYVRVYSGQLKSGTYVYNSAKQKTERVARLLEMHANQYEARDCLSCGDIGVAIGLSATSTGDTLCEEAHPLLLEPIEFPAPVLSVSVAPCSSAERDRLMRALRLLADEDPTFQLRHDPETGQTVISGMGELHVEVIVERLRRQYDVDPIVGPPSVAYRETLTRSVRVEHKHVKQTGGRGQYAHVVLVLEPLPMGRGFEFFDEVKGGSVPAEYVPAVERGVVEAMARGPWSQSPVVDVAVRLVDGSFHEVDSSDLAFQTCARDAFRKGFLEGKPALLEPVCSMDVAVPEDCTGAVAGSIGRRRGRILGVEARGTGQTRLVRAVVPLAETFGYATDLRSMTSGRGTFQVRFERYERVPEGLETEVLKRRRQEGAAGRD